MAIGVSKVLSSLSERAVSKAEEIRIAVTRELYPHVRETSRALNLLISELDDVFGPDDGKGLTVRSGTGTPSDEPSAPEWRLKAGEIWWWDGSSWTKMV